MTRDITQEIEFDECPNLARTYIVKSLFRDLLGPKHSHDEEIEHPYDKYMVGVLKARNTNKKLSNTGVITDSYEKAHLSKNPTRNEFPNSEDSDFETDDTDFKIDADTDLNLMQGAHSLGLSFVVSGNSPTIELCCTWGRYKPMSSYMYKRQTSLVVSKPIDISQYVKKHLIDPRSYDVNVHGEDAKLYVQSRENPNTNSWNVSVFLENTAFHTKQKISNNTESIFQPQIRVICSNGTSLDDLGTSDPIPNADSSLFHKKHSKGRGHLCGVVWKDVDPGCDSAHGDYFDVMWPDSMSPDVPRDIRNRFSCPDIRTEYIPMYTILQPRKATQSEIQLKAADLSEMWDPQIIEETLKPIVLNYRKWIDQQKLECPQNLQHAYERLDECASCANRIQQGINLLLNDEKARLAFCFMNKAMDLKNKWAPKQGIDFSWRTFQIAFILQTIPGLIISGNTSEKETCDILWFPTGGGKTEAYMGLMLFSFAYRRLCHDRTLEMDGGVSVISRYTLRLLTLQQFTRTLGIILAADLLRVENWHPRNATFVNKHLIQKNNTKCIWGKSRFSLGLWIGGDLTPNQFNETKKHLHAEGALLPKQDKGAGKLSRGDPAQITNCPCCNAILAIPSSQSQSNDIRTITWIIKSDKPVSELEAIPDAEFNTRSHTICKNGDSPPKSFTCINKNSRDSYYALCVNFTTSRFSSDEIDTWWSYHIKRALNNSHLESTKASRPGYFFMYKKNKPYDFVIHCPNPKCPTWVDWHEHANTNSEPLIAEPFIKPDNRLTSINTPIPAFTIDPQVYGRCPTVIIATADKFARLPFEPAAASIFGNVDTIHTLTGFQRKAAPPNQRDGELTPAPGFYPPQLIIQDELHLIEGPLGSMVGLYELAVDALTSHNGHKPKYVASTATVNEAKAQVGMIYRRTARVFPPNGIFDGDNYFSYIGEDRTCVNNKPGRLYVGLLVTRGMLIGLVKIYASILSSVYRRKVMKTPKDSVDPYWTLVGYFNAIRELAIALNLYNSDILRDVKKLSSDEYFSTRHTSHSETMPPLTRFIPIKIKKNSALESIVVYCSNDKGKISLALYDSNPVTNKPSTVLSGVKDSSPQTVHKGPNYFVLSDIVTPKSSLVYVAVHNHSDETEFECNSKLQSYSSSDLNHGTKINFNDVKHFTELTTSLKVCVRTQSRDLVPTKSVELSSSTPSFELPQIMNSLESPEHIDALFTTSIFGTGVDINRLGLMLVAGQPKSTSSYIQATGRIGRQHPGLIITWLRATRVRDLSHYENFVGYHRAINRYVEPISSAPFSEKALKTCLGPVLVAILRNASRIGSSNVDPAWIHNPNHMFKNYKSAELESLKTHIVAIYKSTRAYVEKLQLPPEEFNKIYDHAILLWHNINKYNYDLKYDENTFGEIKHDVVLGTQRHTIAQKISVYENTHNSLRDVEPTFTLGEQWVNDYE